MKYTEKKPLFVMNELLLDTFLIGFFGETGFIYSKMRVVAGEDVIFGAGPVKNI